MNEGKSIKDSSFHTESQIHIKCSSEDSKDLNIGGAFANKIFFVEIEYYLRRLKGDSFSFSKSLGFRNANLMLLCRAKAWRMYLSI